MSGRMLGFEAVSVQHLGRILLGVVNGGWVIVGALLVLLLLLLVVVGPVGRSVSPVDDGQRNDDYDENQYFIHSSLTPGWMDFIHTCHIPII